MDVALPPPGFMFKRGTRGKSAGDPSTPSAGVNAGTVALNDMPQGFERALPVSASVAAFHRCCEWFYVDPAGDEHGPVPLQKISNWHRKGHFPDNVKVRCRSPWYAVGPLMNALEEAPNVDTPTALWKASNTCSSEREPPGSFASATVPAAATAAAVETVALSLTPPPPPPRPAAPPAVTAFPRGGDNDSSVGAGAIGGRDSELHALFLGEAARGVEPVWYYLDRNEQVQGPFRASAMIGRVCTGVIKDNTPMCGVESKLGFPPERSLYRPLSELIALVRRGEPHYPASIDALRSKSSMLVGVPPAAPVPAGQLPAGQPPPPPRRTDSVEDGHSGGFGLPARGSDALTWRKDIPPLSTAPSAASAGLGGAAEGAAGTAQPQASSDSSSPAQEGGRGSDAVIGSDDGSSVIKAASYHSSNAAALNAVLPLEQDFEYGDDFKWKRQPALALQGARTYSCQDGHGGAAAAAGRSGVGSMDEPGPGNEVASTATAPHAAMMGQLGALQQQQQAAQQQAMQQQQQQQLASQQQAQLTMMAAAAADVPGQGSGPLQSLATGMLLANNSAGSTVSTGGSGSLSGLSSIIAASLMNLQLQQPSQQHQVTAVSVAMPQQQPAIPGLSAPQQQQLQLLLQSGQLQPQQAAVVLANLQQQQSASVPVPAFQLQQQMQHYQQLVLQQQQLQHAQQQQQQQQQAPQQQQQQQSQQLQQQHSQHSGMLQAAGLVRVLPTHQGASGDGVYQIPGVSALLGSQSSGVMTAGSQQPSFS